MTASAELSKSWLDTWAQSMTSFTKAMLSGGRDGAGAGNAQSLLEENFAALRETWQTSMEKWSAFAEEGRRPEAFTPEALLELFKPARWSGPGSSVFDSGLREVLEGPKYATLWNMDHEVLRLQQLASERDKLTLAYQAIVQKAWNKAFQRFSQSMALNKDEAPATWRSLTDRWLAVANEVLIEAHRSEEFIAAQTRMLRAASDYRLQERRLAEALCTASHIPTRTEMDEMQQVVTALRREIRLLRRQAASPEILKPSSTTSSPDTARTVPAKAEASTTRTKHRTDAPVPPVSRSVASASRDNADIAAKAPNAAAKKVVKKARLPSKV